MSKDTSYWQRVQQDAEEYMKYQQFLAIRDTIIQNDDARIFCTECDSELSLVITANPVEDYKRFLENVCHEMSDVYCIYNIKFKGE